LKKFNVLAGGVNDFVSDFVSERQTQGRAIDKVRASRCEAAAG
jgi:carbon starvation protein CstA